MGDRPIVFSAPMIRALLAGTKTQTRRLVRSIPPAPEHDSVVHPPQHDSVYFDAYCGGKRTPANPRGMTDQWCWWTRDDRAGHGCRIGYVPGDRLYVREHWRTSASMDHLSPVKIGAACLEAGYDWPWAPMLFIADGTDHLRGHADEAVGKHRQGMHMPRWASRLTLTVSDVRVQRLQDISEEDAKAEGVAKLAWDGEDSWYESDRGTHRCGFAGIWQHLHGADSWDANPWVVALTFSVAHGNIDRIPA